MTIFLTGRLLVATPSMADERFVRTVILLCDHDEDHAFGLILNRLVTNLSMHELFEQIGVPSPVFASNFPILDGGPCQIESGFVIHSAEWANAESVKVANGISFCASKQIFLDIATRSAPKNLCVALGYAGWGAGQLESEIGQNAWLVGDADVKIVFGAEIEDKWGEAMAQMGIDPTRLSSTIANA